MTSEKEQTLLEAREIRRQLPVNIVREDEEFFRRLMVAMSNRVYKKEFYNIYVNNEVFLKQNFKILPESFGDSWQISVYNRTGYLLKSYAKDWLRTKIELSEVLWCFDTFSTGGYFHWITEIAPRIWLASKYVEHKVPLLIPEYFLNKWRFAIDILRPFKRELIPFKESQRPFCRKMHFISPPGGPFNYQPVRWPNFHGHKIPINLQNLWNQDQSNKVVVNTMQSSKKK